MIVKAAVPNPSLIQQAGALLQVIWGRKLLVWLLAAGLLAASGLGLVYYGMLLHKMGEAEALNDLAHNLAVTRWQVIPNYFKGLLANPEAISLDIKFGDFQRILYNRELCLERGVVLDGVKKQNIPAKLTYQERSYPVTLQMTGKNLDHLNHPKKWSYQVKMKGENTLFGMKEFVLMRPEVRGALSDWVCHEIERREGLIALKYELIDVTVNGDHHGVYAIEEHFDKHVVESNRLREGIIFKPGLQEPFVFNRKKIASSATLKAQLDLLNRLWTALLAGDLPTSKLFDVDKLAVHYALADLVNGRHEHFMGNTHYYFNPVTSLIEPIGREWGALRYGKDEVTTLFIENFGDYDAAYHQKIFADPRFVNKYFQALERLAQQSYLDDFFREIEPELQKRLAVIYQENPAYAYPKQYLYRNQEYIRAQLAPRKLPVAAYYRGRQEGKIVLALRHLNALPLEVVSLAWKAPATTSSEAAPAEPVAEDEEEEAEEVVFAAAQPVLLPAGQQQESYLAEFLIPRDSSWTEGAAGNLTLLYRTPGTSSFGKATVLPWREAPPPGAYDLIRREANYREFAFVSVDEAAKRITIKPGEYRLERDLIIPSGYTFVCGAGVRLNLANRANILSYSPLEWRGVEQNPVLIHSAEGTGQGLIVLNAKKPSVLEYATFRNLANPTEQGWELTGALTFYQSPVQISHCQFLDNRSEDGLNIIRSPYTIEQSLFQHTSSDAFDADFSDGKISNTRFINMGNDAMDVSGSALTVENVFVEGAGDKGLSTGEDSRARVKQLEIKNSAIAVGSKDQTDNLIDGLTITGCQLGLTVYQKKSEFGPAAIRVLNLKLSETARPYLVEERSTLLVEGRAIPPSRENVKEILYGVEYGKASVR